MTRIANILAVCSVLAVVVGLSACGKKMNPTPPEDSTYPRQYPNPELEKKK